MKFEKTEFNLTLEIQKNNEQTPYILRTNLVLCKEIMDLMETKDKIKISNYGWCDDSNQPKNTLGFANKEDFKVFINEFQKILYGFGTLPKEYSGVENVFGGKQLDLFEELLKEAGVGIEKKSSMKRK